MMSGRTTRTNPTPPVIECACCGQVLSTRLQDGGGYFPDRWCIQCENLDCDLWMQTATLDGYPFENLESYLAYGRSTRSERAQRKLESQAAAQASQGAS